MYVRKEKKNIMKGCKKGTSEWNDKEEVDRVRKSEKSNFVNVVVVIVKAKRKTSEYKRKIVNYNDARYGAENLFFRVVGCFTKSVYLLEFEYQIRLIIRWFYK